MPSSWRLWLAVDPGGDCRSTDLGANRLSAPREDVGYDGITDLAATSPLNQPGGGVAPAEAYEVYSALYQAPVAGAAGIRGEFSDRYSAGRTEAV